MEMAHPSPARRAALARPGAMCPLAPTAPESLTALLRDIQATLPDQSSTGFAAALNAAIARIIHLLLAMFARLATGHPRAVETPAAAATTAANPSSAPRPRAISRPNRTRTATPAPATPPSHGRTPRPLTRPKPHPPCRDPVATRDRPGHPRRRAAPSRAPPARNRQNAPQRPAHPHDHNIPISKQKPSPPIWPHLRHPTILTPSPHHIATTGEPKPC